MRSMWGSMVLLGGRPDGISLGKTWEYSLRNFLASEWSGVSVSSCGAVKRIISLKGLSLRCEAKRVGSKRSTSPQFGSSLALGLVIW